MALVSTSDPAAVQIAPSGLTRKPIALAEHNDLRLVKHTFVNPSPMSSNAIQGAGSLQAASAANFYSVAEAVAVAGIISMIGRPLNAQNQIPAFDERATPADAMVALPIQSLAESRPAADSLQSVSADVQRPSSQMQSMQEHLTSVNAVAPGTNFAIQNSSVGDAVLQSLTVASLADNAQPNLVLNVQSRVNELPTFLDRLTVSVPPSLVNGDQVVNITTISNPVPPNPTTEIKTEITVSSANSKPIALNIVGQIKAEDGSLTIITLGQNTKIIADPQNNLFVQFANNTTTELYNVGVLINSSNSATSGQDSITWFDMGSYVESAATTQLSITLPGVADFTPSAI